MNSSMPPTRNAISSAWVQLVSNWIEIVAIPVASAIMETQPILLGILFLGKYFFGSNGQMPATVPIPLVLPGLHWWAMWSNSSSGTFRARWKVSAILPVLSNLLAVLLVAGFLLLTNSASAGNGGSEFSARSRHSGRTHSGLYI